MENLLCDILSKHGPSGDEGEICKLLEAESQKYCDEVSVDTMGNLIARQKGSKSDSKKIMLSAHMDSIGYVVTHIEDEGFLRVGKLGGVDPREMLNAPISFKNGTKGVLVKEEKTTFAKTTVNDVVIDIGAKDKEDAEKSVELGDTAVITIPPMTLGNDNFVSPYLDNRISCFILLEVMKLLKEKKSPNDIYFVFSAQEEVGIRGAKTAAYSIDPSYGLAIDVTDVLDNVGTEKNGTCKLGEGAGIKIMDRSVICHPEVVETLENLSKSQNIKVQRDILKLGGTDAGAIHVSRNGVKTGGISIPCRYIHSPGEMVNLNDVKASIDLTVAFCQSDLK